MAVDWKQNINELTAPYLLPVRKVYIVPVEVWKQCLDIYESIDINRPGEQKPAFTAITHPNNHYPILALTKYLFIDLGV